MLSSSATFARNVSTVSSWNDESSSTYVRVRSGSSAAMSGSPMLPATIGCRPATRRISPMSAVVVDFPFEPVMAMTVPFS